MVSRGTNRPAMFSPEWSSRVRRRVFFGAGPPLVDGTVVLEEFAESGATKAAMRPGSRNSFGNRTACDLSFIKKLSILSG